MAKQKDSSLMTIEEIRMWETCMFWLERLLMLTLFLFPFSKSPLSTFTASLFLVSNFIYSALFVERQLTRRRRPFFFEPDGIFYTERAAILIAVAHYVVPGGCVICQFIGFLVLLVTNYIRITRSTIPILDSMSTSGISLTHTPNAKMRPMNSSTLSSKTHTPNAKETGKNIDQEKEEEFEQEVRLQEAIMGRRFPGFSVPSPYEALQVNNSAIFETKSPTAMEPSKDDKVLKKEEAVVEDEGLKEKSGVKAETRTSGQLLKTFHRRFLDSFREWDDPILQSHAGTKKEASDHGKEFKTAEDRPDESEDSETLEDVQEEQNALTDEFGKIEDDQKEEKVACDEGMQEDRKNSSASKEVKIEEEDQKEVIAMADEVKEAKDEAGAARDFVVVNHSSWEEPVTNAVCDEIEACFNEKITNEVEEAKDEQEGTGNCTSDDDSSWEEVQNILGVASSNQKNTDELEEAEQEEVATSSYDSEESSWDEGQSHLNRKPCASISSCKCGFQEQLDDCQGISLKWEQEKKDLTEKLEVATKFWKQYEENYHTLQKGLSGQCTRLTDECTRLSNELESEWNMERRSLKTQLNAATKLLSHFQVIGKEFVEEFRKWNVEKEYLRTKMVTVAGSLKEEHIKWKDEKNELREVLDAAAQSLELCKLTGKGFAEQRQRWDEEKNALNATISDAEENVQYWQNLANTYAEHYRQVTEKQSSWNQYYLDKWTADTDDLSTKLNAATSSAETYKGMYNQSEEHCQYYKACFEVYEERWRTVMEENLALSAKLNTESSAAESYNRLVDDLEDKCHRLEEEKTDLADELYAATALSEIYRALLHDSAT